MSKYSTKRIEYLFKGEDTWIKNLLKKYFFKRNPYVSSYYRAPYLKFKRTTTEQEECNKCANDIIYFAENYYYNLNIEGVLELIKLRDYQKKVLESYVNGRTIVCSSRQMGTTTLNKIFSLWSILFNPVYVQFVTEPMNTHYNFIESLRAAYIKIPYYMQKGITRFNKHEIVCDDYSRITSLRAKLKPKDISLKNFVTVADNAAWLCNADLADIERTLRFKGKVIMTSTPNGMNNFYNLWKNSLEKNTYNFNPIKLMWFQRDGWDDLWADQQIKNIGQDAFDEECNLKFRNKSK